MEHAFIWIYCGNQKLETSSELEWCITLPGEPNISTTQLGENILQIKKIDELAIGRLQQIH